MATGYNLVHLQVAPKETEPTFKDINYAVSAEFTVEQDSEQFQADGANVMSAFSPREGTGSISFGSADLETIALMTGDVFSSSGTAGSAIDRLEFRGSTVPPSLVLSAYIPNVDGNSAHAGMRITVPNAKLTVPNASYEQESWTEFESDVTFSPDANGVMLIWENLSTDPDVGMSGNVMPVNLVAPAG